MKYVDILESVDSARNTSRLHNIYFYAMLNNYSPAFMEGLFERIQKRTGLNREQMLEAQEIAAEHWDETLMAADELLNQASLDQYMLPVLNRNTSAFGDEQLTSLLQTLISCTLQKASLISFKNQLKPEKLQQFLRFAFQKRAKSVGRAIQNLLSLVSSGKAAPTDKLYLEKSALLIDLLARDFLSFQSKKQDPSKDYSRISFEQNYDQPVSEKQDRLVKIL